ncbi:metacaspase-9-like [Magnolia sinica]|uniref:metacaspase-9-like n=1 Tax=Magnolia sinica TaxID=86752 RepID=UPI00265AE72C|nr:metacaspase-9-like [Magnolia sinica]
MKKRLALLVGCNYPNTQHELHGCYNDVETMQTLLTNRFGFVKEDIKIMIDKQNEPEKPTGDNIRTALVDMIHGANKGDTFFFFFSGLGALFESLENDNSPAIVSCEFDAIRDNGILLSSCSKIQKSVEVDPNNNKSKAYGAFTNAVETTLKKHPGQITNRKLVQLAEDFLNLKGIGQHPCLFSSDKNADALFLGQKIGKSV